MLLAASIDTNSPSKAIRSPRLGSMDKDGFMEGTVDNDRILNTEAGMLTTLVDDRDVEMILSGSQSINVKNMILGCL